MIKIENLPVDETLDANAMMQVRGGDFSFGAFFSAVGGGAVGGAIAGPAGAIAGASLGAAVYFYETCF